MRTEPALALAVALTCACTGMPDRSRSDDSVTFTLQAGPRNAGQVGKALMGPQGDRTAITLTVTGVPPWVGRPVQLYTFVYAGSCAGHDPAPAYALNEVVQAGLFSNSGAFGPFTLVKLVPASMAALRSRPYALVVRTSPADGNVDIFCGEMNSM